MNSFRDQNITHVMLCVAREGGGGGLTTVLIDGSNKLFIPINLADVKVS